MWRPGKLRFLIGVKNPLAIGRPRPPENTAPCGVPLVARFATPVGLRPPFVAHPVTLPHPDRRALLILFAAQQDLLAIDRLAQPPAGIDPAYRLEAARWRGGKPAVLPNRIGGQRRVDAFEQTKLWAEVLAEPQIGAIPLDPVREQCRPMERLLRPHREAVNQRDPLDAEHLRQQPLLHPDIVGRREMRVTAAVERRRVAGRG